MFFRLIPADLFARVGQDEDLIFAQDTSLASQFVQQRKLRMRAQEGTLKEIADSKQRRLLARNKTINCPNVAAGDSALFYKAQSRKSSPRWRGHAKILDIFDTGVTVSLQSQTFKVARYCVRKRQKETDATDKKWRNSLHRGCPWVGLLTSSIGLAPPLSDGLNDDIEMADGDKPTNSGNQATAEPDEPVVASPRLILAPDSPPRSARDPSEMA